MTSILHGTWLVAERRFFLWGEFAERTTRRSRKAKTDPHPFQLTVESLRERLAGLSFNAEGPPERELMIWLPSVGSMPLPLRELRNSGIDAPEGEAVLASWRVRGLLLNAGQALELLIAVGKRHDSGADLRAWRIAALLVAELVAGQQVLPALIRDGHRLRATWQPRPVPATAGKIAALGRGLPALCRAVVETPSAAPAPRALVDEFIAAAADSLIRDLAAADEATSARLAGWRQPPFSPGGVWMAALLGPDPMLPLQGRAADELLKAWQEWVGPEHVAGDDVFRIAFRLEPPADPTAPWALSYMLQAVDDPSLLVPAAQLWRERGQQLTFLDRRFAQPQERLLRGLAFAGRLVPAIERSLHSRAPDHADLTLDEAFAFLRDAAPLLEQSGFGLLVPSWWGGSGRIKARARTSEGKVKLSEEPSRLSFESMVNFRWELTVGNHPIDKAEFERLVALKQPLVQVRGEWIVLDPQQAKQALGLLQQGGEMTVAQALRLGLGGSSEPLPGGIAFGGLEADGALGKLLRDLSETQQMEELEQPTSFQGELRPYQRRGFSWLNFMRRSGLGACLADDMGLGKCLLGSSLVFVNGTLQPAEQIWEQFAGATTSDGEGLWAVPTAALVVNAIDRATGKMIPAQVQHLYRQYVREHLRTIHLEDGSSITITGSHKLLTSKGWSETIEVGDHVCVPAHLRWTGAPADLDLIRVLAWQIAAGTESRHRATVTITQSNRTVLEDLLATLLRIGRRYDLKLHQPAIYTPEARTSYLRLTSRSYQRFLEAHGYAWGRPSAEKTIPDLVMQSDDQAVRTFLRAYFDAEGSVSPSMASIEITTASALLIQQLATLLRRLGIWMHVSQKQKRATDGSGIDRTYQIGVISDVSARRFLSEDRPALAATRHWPQLPLEQEVFYCRVTSVEAQPYEGWVYDLEIADQHNFVANNIICHNTAQAIALMLHEKALTKKGPPSLLVCPTSVVGNWQRELTRFAPSLRVHIHHGAERLRGAEFGLTAARHDLTITSYPLLARDRDTLTAIPWRLAVLDEAQNIKNSDTRQHQAARALKAEARIALTGTPVENRLAELWSIMAYLNPGYLGGETEFRRSFARPIERAGDSETAERLRRLTGPFILRRLKTDPTIINDLPDKIEMKVFVPLTQEQATLYEATVRDALNQIESADEEGEQQRRRGLVLAMLTKLKQICNHPTHFLKDGSALDGRSGKLERLDEMLEEVLAAEDRALIFTQFAEMGHLLQGHLSERLFAETLFLHGGTPAKERDALVRRFQAAEGPPLFILSLKAGGTGLNLTRASHVFHFDRWWNPAVEDQATDRAFRIGQVKNVQVHKFVCGGTLEEKIDQMIEGKRALAAQVLGAGEAWLTELSTAQLRELVALRREEISD